MKELVKKKRMKTHMKKETREKQWKKLRTQITKTDYIFRNTHIQKKDNITRVHWGVWGNAYISAQLTLRVTCEFYDIFLR